MAVRQTNSYDYEDAGTKVHQGLDCGLIERVVHRVRMLVVAMVANPRGFHIRTQGYLRRTPVTDQLELEDLSVESST